jgi:hypothetical protein
MIEQYTELDATFTTADTEGDVLISYQGDVLTVSFRSFGTPLQIVRFLDARVFCWTGWEHATSDAPVDRACEVTRSSLLEPFMRFSVKEYSFRHFRLGFNAKGRYLDVIATRLEHSSAANT